MKTEIIIKHQNMTQFISSKISHLRCLMLLFSIFLIFNLSIFSYNSFSQSIGIGASAFTPDASAILDVNSTTQGALMPRMTTTHRDAINSPAEGLLIFNTSTKCFEAYVNSTWNTVSCPAACNPPAAPTANAATNVVCTSFNANWSAVSGATYYYLDVSTNSGFSNFVTGYNNLNVGNVTSLNVNNLNETTDYYYRVRAATVCNSSNSNVIGPVTTITVPSAPTTGAHTPAQTQIVWNWNAASGATGYKWGTTSVYSAATDNGASTSKTQTGLTCNTNYTLYVWAYNTCGNSTLTTLTQITNGCCTPGSVADGTLTKTTSCIDSYTIIKWTGTGSTTWTVPSNVTGVKYLVVAGGGAGSNQGAGGGGGVLTNYPSGADLSVSSSVSVKVGAGGTATYSADGTSGGNSVFSTITAHGGGYGSYLGNNGGNGGSGGSSGCYTTGNAGTGISGEGYNAGSSASYRGAEWPSAGGGGAGGLGQNAQSYTVAGNGGIGVTCDISGESLQVGGGGGGGLWGSGTPGTGSYGGGNGKSSSSGTCTSGTAGTGGGGGGRNPDSIAAGNGGSGIVIIRFLQ